MEHRVQACIAGGGPAGMMLGVLLARAGVKVAVLEKHPDFLRDFRGDTIHPSTMDVMDELGWLDEFLKLPHQPVRQLSAQFGEERIALADFSKLRVTAPFIAMMPQWDFLNFLADKGRRYDGFELHMRTRAAGLLREGGKVRGVEAQSADGSRKFFADVVIAADGRGSTLRQAAKLEPQDFGAPMDVLWFRLPRAETDTDQTQGRFDAGRIFIMLNRGDYWQCAFVIPKGGDARVRAQGLDAFRAAVGKLVPFDRSRVNALTQWDQIKLLTVTVDRLKEWAVPGLLCIGDAAHAMSPVGGVGINLAIQDAVAAANILVEPLLRNSLAFDDLRKVQQRRDFPTRMTQRLQLAMQSAIIAPSLASTRTIKPPLVVRALTRLPLLNRLPARLIGIGIRPEHVCAQIRQSAG